MRMLILFFTLFAASVYAASPFQGPVDANVVNTPNVVVSNTDSNPVPIIVPTRQPVQFSVQVNLGSLLQNVDDAFTVPEGKRLVIEYVSTEASEGLRDLPPNAAYLPVLITRVAGSPAPPIGVVHRLNAVTPIQGGGGPAVRVWGGGQMVKIYASAGTTIRMGAKRSYDASSLSVTVFASGYLEDDV